ncbi:hypothetical protein D3C85_1627320 [compost metagenome]
MTLIAKSHLNLVRIRFKIIQVLLDQHPAAMHNPNMITQILDLPQIMRRDQHGQLPLGDLLEQ